MYKKVLFLFLVSFSFVASGIAKEKEILFSLKSKQLKEGSLLIVMGHFPQLQSRVQQEEDLPFVVKFEGMSSPFFWVNRNLGKSIALLAVAHHHPRGLFKVQVLDTRDQSLVKSLPFRVISGHYRRETLKVDPAFVQPAAQQLKRIVEEQQEIQEIYKKITLKKLWTPRGFDWPLKLHFITSPYGTKRFFNQHLKSFHNGLDLRAPLGTPIYASANGQVVLAKELYFTGNTVILDHGYGLFTLYAHLQKLGVQLDQEIKKHQWLGDSGKTGRVSGPHLHWGLSIQGVKINPMDALLQLKL